MRRIEQKIFAAALLIAVAGVSASAAERTWTRSEILAVADAEAKRSGYDVEQMSVMFDIYNSQWHDYVNSATNFTPFPELQAKLKDRKYWAVYYAPMVEMQLGGDLTVFIDRKTAEIIDVIRGQ